MSLSTTYNRLRAFVDDFANSSSDSATALRKPENREAWYAEWDDNYMGDLLDNPLTKSILRRIADSYYGKQLDALIDEATALSPDTYPSLFNVFEQCCETLGIVNPPEVYVTGRMKGINALSLEVNGDQLILVGTKVVCLSPSEQSFLLGHELGHHQQGNLVCHTVNGLMDNLTNASEIFGPLLLDTIEVPLKRWCRCSEFNADRAGYLCCEDIDAVKQLFIRLGMKEMPSVYARYCELETSHPLLETRWSTLLEYIKVQPVSKIHNAHSANNPTQETQCGASIK